MMPSLADLPAPPPGRTGWPWTEACEPLAPARADGSAWPRITIVTPSYNQGEFIEETIRSVLLQGYPNLEYVVMDGGSKDGTVAILEKYAPWLDHWESQKDGGQAAAVNKALPIATGVWFQNINSDDVLLPGSLALIGQSDRDTDMVCGDVVEFSDAHTYRVHNRRLSIRNLLQRQWRTDHVSWHQPGVFMQRAHLQELSGYDSSLQYVFDFHLTCRYLERFNRVRYLDEPLVRFRIHPAAKSSAWGDVYTAESVRARELLAQQFQSAHHRRMAAREAARRRLFTAVDRACQTQERDAAAEALHLVSQFPLLFLDRMFLGSLRRSPGFWARAWFRSVA